MWTMPLLGPSGCESFAGRSDTYGGKPVLFDAVRQEPVFAEQLILRALTVRGQPMTDGAWLDSYGSKFRNGGCHAETFAMFPPARLEQLKCICAALKLILERHNMKPTVRTPYCRGTWDVFCWSDPNDLRSALFIESKGPNDRFATPPDYKEPMWLEAALLASEGEGWGWTEANFRVLEWSGRPVVGSSP